MNKSIMKTNPFLNLIYNSVIKLPTPINISIWWNFGSLLGMSLMIQILTGLFLSMHYCANTILAFNSMIHIIQDVNSGWMFRLIHMNGASFFFFCMFIHIGRGMYYGSYNLLKPWTTGVIIFLTSMMTAFMGYVLPWGQMSFWGATVITNLMSTIPYIGMNMVEWIWGGFSINNPTLNRFFTLHFMMPFIITSLVMIHLMFIHETGSNNPLGINSNLLKLPFNIYFTLKDMMGFFLMISSLLFLILTNPFILMDPENFILANPMITPIHIQPEWYFLFAYAILRSIPNKLGGVIALLMSIMILMIMPFLKINNFQSIKFYPMNQFMFWNFINMLLILTWLGSQPIEIPYIKINQLFTITYFLFYPMNSIMMNLWNKMIKYNNNNNYNKYIFL